MIDTPHIADSPAIPAAVIRFVIPRDEIRNVMGPGIGELMTTLAAQGIRPAGPVFSHHFRMNVDVFDFELGVPVSSPVMPAGRVAQGELPACRVVRTVYHGPYEGLGPAWGELESWIAGQKLVMAEDLWECYVSGPESGGDPSTWQTELNHMLR